VHGMLLQAEAQSSLHQSSERHQCKDLGMSRMPQEPGPRWVLGTATPRCTGPHTNLRLGQSWTMPGNVTRL
jgi:hypothetical protein